MVAPEHQRTGAGGKRRARFRRHVGAHLRDCAKKACAALGTAFGVLAEWDGNVSRVFDGVAESFEAGPQVGVADGERAHIDAATAGAKVHRDADNANGSHV